MRVLVAQLNPTIGDLGANVDRLLAAVAAGRDQRADLVIAPELAVTGYPPRDLLDHPGFVRDAVAAVARLTGEVRGPALLCGAVVGAGKDPLVVESRISNGAVLIDGGKVVACHKKVLLPTYDVFDEARYFTPGTTGTLATVAGTRLGITVCEDIWNDKQYWQRPRYDHDPLLEEISAGAELLVNISASPYDRRKPAERLAMLQARVRRHGTPLVYVNQVGGNDSVLFDGRSIGLLASGEVGMRGAAFAEGHSLLTVEGKTVLGELAPEPQSWEADVTAALTMGLRDYVRKCGFSKVVLGLSGGIDSALTAALAVRALGKERVLGVGMPSRYSSQGSLDDARELARRLGIRFDVVSIEPMLKEYLESLERPLGDELEQGLTEENLQARIRGALLMAYSNATGALVLTTGNKSELAVGYCTLYGDMCGGLAVISDLYKTQVYALARHLNAESPVIPEPSITKAPSAELRPEQTDQDTLPPYEVLDGILEKYIEGSAEPEEIPGERALVERVMGMVDRAEYKRRQMAPGLRVSTKAFGEGRRLPIAQGYSHS